MQRGVSFKLTRHVDAAVDERRGTCLPPHLSSAAPASSLRPGSTSATAPVTPPQPKAGVLVTKTPFSLPPPGTPPGVGVPTTQELGGAPAPPTSAVSRLGRQLSLSLSSPGNWTSQVEGEAGGLLQPRAVVLPGLQKLVLKANQLRAVRAGSVPVCLCIPVWACGYAACGHVYLCKGVCPSK